MRQGREREQSDDGQIDRLRKVEAVEPSQRPRLVQNARVTGEGDRERLRLERGDAPVQAEEHLPDCVDCDRNKEDFAQRATAKSRERESDRENEERFAGQDGAAEENGGKRGIRSGEEEQREECERARHRFRAIA